MSFRGWAGGQGATLDTWKGSLTTAMRDGTGLMYRRNRYYDPLTGRFTQLDPIGLAGGSNGYGFPNGDPVNYEDPFGLQAGGPCKVRDLDCLAYMISVRLKSRLVETAADAVGIAVAGGGGRLVAGLEGMVGGRAAAAGAEAAAAGTSAVANANKLGHIFGKAAHNLGALVEEFGGQQGAFSAVQGAIDQQVAKAGIRGVFEEIVRVGSQTVTVRGRVIDGVAKIGTFFVP
jgi:RHS repeat-associated protein